MSMIPSLPPPKMMISSLIATALWPCLGCGAGPEVVEIFFHLKLSGSFAASILPGLFANDRRAYHKACFSHDPRLVYKGLINPRECGRRTPGSGLTPCTLSVDHVRSGSGYEADQKRLGTRLQVLLGRYSKGWGLREPLQCARG